MTTNSWWIAMEYYHVIIRYTTPQGESEFYQALSIRKDKLLSRFVVPYNENKPFLIAGTHAARSQIKQFLIFRSNFLISPEFILPTGKVIFEEEIGKISKCLLAREIQGVEALSKYFSKIDEGTVNESLPIAFALEPPCGEPI
jgi:hypothetical protein